MQVSECFKEYQIISICPWKLFCVFSTNKSSLAMMFCSVQMRFQRDCRRHLKSFCILVSKQVGGLSLSDSACACSKTESDFKHFVWEAEGETENKTTWRGHFFHFEERSSRAGVSLCVVVGTSPCAVGKDVVQPGTQEGLCCGSRSYSLF